MMREKIDFFLETAKKSFPSHPAVITDKEIISYGTYAKKIEETSTHLLCQGFRKGDRISAIGPTTLDYLLLAMATIRMGGIFCPISPRFPLQQVLEMLSIVRCSGGFFSKSLTYFEKINFDDERFRCFPLESWTDLSFGKNSLDIPNVLMAQPSTIVFTSGSSGRAKAALHRYENHYYSALGSNQVLPFKYGDRWLLSLPLYHVGGLAIVFRAALGGGSIVLPPSGMDMTSSIVKYGITHVSMVPTQLWRLLQQKERMEEVKQRVKCILVGGSAVSRSLLRKSKEQDLPVHTTYGSTEMSSQIATTRSKESYENRSTSGHLLPYREIKINDEQEVMVRGKTLFSGYMKNGQLERPFDSEGWFSTGDLGQYCSRRGITILGRKDNMFISGGENIQPEEIECQLVKHPEILEAVVVAVSNPEFGARPVAFVSPTDRYPGPEALRHFLEKRLPRFKLPDAFFLLKDENSLGLKVCRRHLTQQAEALMNVHL